MLSGRATSGSGPGMVRRLSSWLLAKASAWFSLIVQMPEKDGLSTVLELKQAVATKAIHVIMMTSIPEYYIRKREFKEAGGDDFSDQTV